MGSAEATVTSGGEAAPQHGSAYAALLAAALDISENNLTGEAAALAWCLIHGVGVPWHLEHADALGRAVRVCDSCSGVGR